MKTIDLKGQQFEDWFVVKRAENTERGSARWLCRCSCGEEYTVHSADLRKGKSTKCANCKSFIHGFHKHPLYTVWRSMKVRCYCSQTPSYHRYGGRGITVCDLWLDDPKTFIQWCLDKGWRKGLTVERINNNSSYSPSNCRFATRKEQSRNTCQNIKMPNGENFIDAVERLGVVSYRTAYDRIRLHGWNIKDAVSTPPYKQPTRSSSGLHHFFSKEGP